MRFIADFHIHSKYSRATAKNLDLEHIFIAAQLKGVTVVGTGDFTHPGWYSELCEKLEPAENGLFRLRDKIAQSCRQNVPPSCRNTVRFILTAEISNIYKKNGITRKNHNLLFLPDLDSVKRFSAALEKIGNIHSDGRPILGLDARHLLELLLDTNPDGFLVPAHIWTPWFSLLGSKSGFNSLQECFEDLSDHIFALETGLSSDPSMNWRVSALDGLTLISNSDAHSPLKIGREANLFNIPLSYGNIRLALQNGRPKSFLGTIEFFPEEGKYHLDGHRKCQQWFWPEQTHRLRGVCPECGKPLTLGVLNRVDELADRPPGYLPGNCPSYECLIPLDEVLAEIFRVGPGTKRVKNALNNLLFQFGPELSILQSIEPEALNLSGNPLLAEAIRRIRQKKVHLRAGYDGQFGTIRLFEDGERELLTGQPLLFGASPMHRSTSDYKRSVKKSASTGQKRTTTLNSSYGSNTNPSRTIQSNSGQDMILEGLNQQQRFAVLHDQRPLLIAAGPGTGKTLTLTRRVAYLLDRCGIQANHILALTFTQKAAREMEQRLKKLLPSTVKIPKVATFHAFCFDFLRRCCPDRRFKVIDSTEKSYFLKMAMEQARRQTVLDTVGPRELLEWIEKAKQQLLPPDQVHTIIPEADRIAPVKAVYQAYQSILASQGFWDFEDLIFLTVCRLETDTALRRKTRNRYTHILVDEYQDLNSSQYRLVKTLSADGRNLFVIGDPDQAIYGFRGASSRYFHRFKHDFADTAILSLHRNYRSSQTILDAAYQVIQADPSGAALRSRLVSGLVGLNTVGIIETQSEKSEAVMVANMIETLVGGTGFHSFDFDWVDGRQSLESISFSDFAVLFRIGRQADRFADVFNQAGIPYQLANRDDPMNRPGIQEIMAILRLTTDQATYADLEKSAACIVNGIHPKAIRKLAYWGVENSLTLRQALNELAGGLPTGLDDRLRRVLAPLIEAIERFRTMLNSHDLKGKLQVLVDLLSPVLHAAFTENAAALEQMIEMGATYKTDTIAFIEQAALQSDVDTLAEKSEKVSLLTMHAAKGLEFPIVFMVGCEDHMLPYQFNQNAVANLDEERRLFYVAMTRACKNLYFTYPRQRMLHGKSTSCDPSRFLDSIHSDLKSYPEPPKPMRHRRKQLQLNLFNSRSVD